MSDPVQLEIGSAAWWEQANIYGSRGIVDLILQLMVQREISRGKALELLEFTRHGIVPSTVLPDAPWDALNWGHDVGVDVPEDVEAQPTIAVLAKLLEVVRRGYHRDRGHYCHYASSCSLEECPKIQEVLQQLAPPPPEEKKVCVYCKRLAQGNFSIHRDGPFIGPEVPLCDNCGGGQVPELARIWNRIAPVGWKERYLAES